MTMLLRLAGVRKSHCALTACHLLLQLSGKGLLPFNADKQTAFALAVFYAFGNATSLYTLNVTDFTVPATTVRNRYPVLLTSLQSFCWCCQGRTLMQGTSMRMHGIAMHLLSVRSSPASVSLPHVC